MEISLPRGLVEAAGPERRDWLRSLPGTAAALARRWTLTVGPPFEPGGRAAWVAPARTAAGEERVLKLGWRHSEALHEAEGLGAWDGDGAVRLFASAEIGETLALLIERCRPGTALRSRPGPEQDRVVAGLLRRLWREPPAGAPFRPLQALCDMWADAFEARPDAWRALGDAGLARAGLALLRSLPADAGPRRLLATDLHAGNVLAAEREPWLVIDPKPYVGDPTYDALQHMLNGMDRLRRDPEGMVRRMAGLLELDPARLRLWLFARLVQESPDWPGAAEAARALAPA